MSEQILKALVQLFALISDSGHTEGISSRGKDIVRLFLAHHLNQDLIAKYMEIFDEYVWIYHSDDIARGSLKERKRTTLNAVRILAICETIIGEFHQKQKLYVLIQLLDFIHFSAEITENKLDFLETISSAFNIPDEEYHDISKFILESYEVVPGRNNIMIIDSLEGSGIPGIKHLLRENLKGSVALLHITSTNSYILRYNGTGDLSVRNMCLIMAQP
jgi:hypothetical protein